MLQGGEMRTVYDYFIGVCSYCGIDSGTATMHPSCSMQLPITGDNINDRDR